MLGLRDLTTRYLIYRDGITHQEFLNYIIATDNIAVLEREQTYQQFTNITVGGALSFRFDLI